jgi:8-oxo-dGTP pyrophosphatase MutT (NUDIX family)
VTLPRRVGRREVYRGRVFDLEVERFRDEAEQREFDIEVVRHRGGAGVLPVEADGRVVLVHQWRYPLDRLVVEIPAGRIEAGDDPQATALRELEEEAGLRAGRVDPLGSILPAPGYCTERVWIYLARDLTAVPQRLEEDERVEIVRMTLDEALAAVEAGEIDDAKTVIALLRFSVNGER